PMTATSCAGRGNSRRDLRVSRTFSVGGATFEAIAEGFNVFTRPNYNGFNTTAYTAGATTATTPLATPIVLTASTSYLQPNNDGSQPDGTNAPPVQGAGREWFSGGSNLSPSTFTRVDPIRPSHHHAPRCVNL